MSAHEEAIIASQHLWDASGFEGLPRKFIVRTTADTARGGEVALLTTPSSAVHLYDVDLSATTQTTTPRKCILNMPFPPRDVALCPFQADGDSEGCFLATSKSSPIVLWDTSNGTVRASYRAYNPMDEHVSAHSLLWEDCRQCHGAGTTTSSGGGASNPTFYAGYGGAEETAVHVRAFDLLAEGRDALWTYRSPCSAVQKTSIVSTLMHARSNLIGIGFQGTLHHVELVDVRHKRPGAFLRLDDRRGGGVDNGVAAMRMSPTSEWLLYSAPRTGAGTTSVYEWDMRRCSVPSAVYPMPNDVIARGAFFDITTVDGVPSLVAASGAALLIVPVMAGAARRLVSMPGRGGVADADAASLVAVVSDRTETRRPTVAVGGGEKRFAIRDQWEENEGKGHQRPLRRTRSGSPLPPMDGEASDDDAAVPLPPQASDVEARRCGWVHFVQLGGGSS